MQPSNADRSANELVSSLAPMLVPAVAQGIAALRDALRQIADDPTVPSSCASQRVAEMVHACLELSPGSVRDANISVVRAEALRSLEHLCPKSTAAAAIEWNIAAHL